MFESLKDGGKIAFLYSDHIYPFMFTAYKELNPENVERICQMFKCESKAKIEQYCSLAGFTIIKSYQTRVTQFIFESIESLLKWHWATTHGVFDPSLVTQERLQRYLAPYSSKDGTPCLDFRGMEEESTVCRLIAVKPPKQ